MIRFTVLSIFLFTTSLAMATDEAYQITSIHGVIALNMSSELGVYDELHSRSNLFSENGSTFVMERGSKSVVKTVSCPVCGKNKFELAQVSSTESVFRLEHGGLLVRLSDAPEKHRLQIKTPEAVASVRGTSFWVHVHHNGEETLSVNKGAVEFKREGIPSALIQTQESADIQSSNQEIRRRSLSVFERDTILQVVDSD